MLLPPYSHTTSSVSLVTLHQAHHTGAPSFQPLPLKREKSETFSRFLKEKYVTRPAQMNQGI